MQLTESKCGPSIRSSAQVEEELGGSVELEVSVALVLVLLVPVLG